MKKIIPLLFLLMPLSVSSETISVRLDPTARYQTISDFGASDCWLADYVGRYFSAAEREKAARWLFSMDADASGNPLGIGLSSWRVNVGAGSAYQGENSNIREKTRRAECFLQDDGSYDWSQQAGQQFFMQRAREMGLNRFILFSNSAPIYFTKNGLANAGGEMISCNLRDDCYGSFATFLSTVTKHFETEGYGIAYIDPINEPRFDWKDGQEGSPWENRDIARLARCLDSALAVSGAKAEILMPEASSWDLLCGGEGRAADQIAAFFNPASDNFIGDLPHLAKTVAGHSYWTYNTDGQLRSVRENVAAAAGKYGLEVIQSEWSMLGKEPALSTSFAADYQTASRMDMALFLAKMVYADIVFANASAWHYWTAFSPERIGHKNRFYLIRLNALGDDGGESYGDLQLGGTVYDDKNLWALGNYSRFVRPGFRRISADGADDLNGVMATAYISPDDDEIVVVLLNMHSDSRSVAFSLPQNFSASSVRTYITDKNHSLEAGKAMSRLKKISLPPRAVMTVVIDKKK